MITLDTLPRALAHVVTVYRLAGEEHPHSVESARWARRTALSYAAHARARFAAAPDHWARQAARESHAKHLADLRDAGPAPLP